MNILQMSFSAAVLIIAVIIVRALTLYKLPKKTFLILWGVVICRLLIPFSIPSRFSFYTGIDILRRASTETMHFTVPSITTGIPYISNGTSDMGVVDIGKVADSGISTISISISPLVVIWLIGMCVCAIFFITTYIKCRREFKTALPVENDIIAFWQQKHPLRLPVQIRQSDRIKAPLTYGILSPVLLLPQATDWEDETKLQYILTHEFVHIKRFDALTKFLLTAALCIHWFNPLVWIMYVLANRDIELSCDETVVRTFGEPQKSTYALTLIELEEKKSRLIPLSNNFSKNAIEERITAIMKIKKYSIPVIIVAVLLVGGLIIGFATSGAKTSDNPNVQDNTGIFATSPDNSTSDNETQNPGEMSNLEDNNAEVNSFQGQAKTEGDSVTISKRFHPVTGKHSWKRTDPDTGKLQVSYDEGETWLFYSINMETHEEKLSADGITWLFYRIKPETRKEEVSADGVTWQPAPSDWVS
ncbi:MAG: M56 family metallopeptidase [Methanocorpusculum sp.]|nr:M56 family metallopeptidase [Methanocorpusculum sp.]